VRHHLGPGERGDLLRAARVVLVEVGEHDPTQTSRYPGGDPPGGTRRTGVDQGRLVAVAPEIRLADREAQEVETGEEGDDVHGTTVERPPSGDEGLLPTAEPSDQLAA